MECVHDELQVRPEVGAQLAAALCRTLPPAQVAEGGAGGSKLVTGGSLECGGTGACSDGTVDVQALVAGGMPACVTDIVLLSCVHNVGVRGAVHEALWALAGLGACTRWGHTGVCRCWLRAAGRYMEHRGQSVTEWQPASSLLRCIGTTVLNAVQPWAGVCTHP